MSHPKCVAGYFSLDGNVIRQEQLSNKIWFKENISPPVPICYCANVTEEEILYTLWKHSVVRP